MQMPNGFILSKETWDHMPEEQRQWIMFETMQVVNARLKRLERWNKVFSFSGGVLGGIAGALGIKVGG
jgi:outer membrane lipoprotein SlyB